MLSNMLGEIAANTAYTQCFLGFRLLNSIGAILANFFSILTYRKFRTNSPIYWVTLSINVSILYITKVYIGSLSPSPAWHHSMA